MKKKKDNKLIIFGIIIVVILALIAYNTRKKTTKIDYDNMTDEEITAAVQEKIDTIEKNDLSTKGERDRMEYYVASFITDIENKEYEDAYDMLYEDFKTNYFPTLASFEEYVKSKFPKNITLTHNNFERNGDVYVMWVTVGDLLGSKDSGVEMNFVVQEYDLNDFALSFSVN
jgi:hypothetical protein